MTSYCEEQYIHSLEKKIKEQEAVIDWFALKYSNLKFNLQSVVVTPADCIREAREAVKKNES